VQPLSQPEVLAPDRLSIDDAGEPTDFAARTEALQRALAETCAYGQRLWADLNAARRYLLDSLPSDPRTPGATRSGASPTGPDDDSGWDRWIAAYAEVTSALAGPQGDSGFGRSEALREAELRRSAPVLKVHADHPELRTPLTEHSPSPPAASANPPASANPVLRALAFGAAAGLALRLTRPRRRTAGS
jgi:hypothetical protein